MVFEDFEASDEEIVGASRQGLPLPSRRAQPRADRRCLHRQIGTLAAAALNQTVQYAKDRIVFDRPIGKNQAVAHPLADSWIRLQAAEMMTHEGGAAFRRRAKPCGPEANAAKYLATDAGFEAARPGDAVPWRLQHVDRIPRFALLVEARHLKIAPYQQQMVLNFISDKVLGLPKSY